MAPLLRSKTLSVSIDCAPRRVYEFVSNPQNLPKWATAFCRSVKQTASGWIVETQDGQVGIKFVARNDFGVLDHHVTVKPGVELLIPLRVVPNRSGSDINFTLFQSPDTSDAKFAQDTGLVDHDLRNLKKALEK